MCKKAVYVSRLPFLFELCRFISGLIFIFIPPFPDEENEASFFVGAFGDNAPDILHCMGISRSVSLVWYYLFCNSGASVGQFCGDTRADVYEIIARIDSCNCHSSRVSVHFGFVSFDVAENRGRGAFINEL